VQLRNRWLPFGIDRLRRPGTSFSGISADLTSGTVNFSPPLAPGGHATSRSKRRSRPFLRSISPGAAGPGGEALVALVTLQFWRGNRVLGPDRNERRRLPRSFDAYPEILNADSSLNIASLAFVACSGANRPRRGVFGTKTEDSQLPPRLDDRPRDDRSEATTWTSEAS